MFAPLRRCSFSFAVLVALLGLVAPPFGLSAPGPQQLPVTAASVAELKARADSGNATARHELAIFLISSDPSAPGFDQALSWLRSLAAKNVPDAQFLLGYFYEHAKGLPRDVAKALENYSGAAGQAYPPAENNLGALYHYGIGVPQDFAIALRWYRAAALHGDPAGQLNLGTFHYLGYATPVDYSEATKWFRAAAEQGLAPAQDSLAHCYLKGVGVPADYSQAAHWARLAAEQGNPRAFTLLGYLYETGKGLPLDYVSAYAWYSRAVAAGDASTSDRLKTLSHIMTQRQIDQADSLVSARSIPAQHSSDLAASSPNSLFPNP
jgi:uncharacterized protein